MLLTLLARLFIWFSLLLRASVSCDSLRISAPTTPFLREVMSEHGPLSHTADALSEWLVRGKERSVVYWPTIPSEQFGGEEVAIKLVDLPRNFPEGEKKTSGRNRVPKAIETCVSSSWFF